MGERTEQQEAAFQRLLSAIGGPPQPGIFLFLSPARYDRLRKACGWLPVWIIREAPLVLDQ